MSLRRRTAGIQTAYVFPDSVLGMTENTLGERGGRKGQGGQSPRQAQTSQGIILMSALSAISKCRTEIRLGTGEEVCQLPSRKHGALGGDS